MRDNPFARWGVWGLILASGLCLIVLVYVDAVGRPQYAVERAKASGCQDKGVIPLSGLFPETRANTEAYWTAIGALGAIIALAFIYEQVRAAKRTVDAFVESEEGRLWVSGIGSVANAQGRQVTHWSVTNLGRTYVRTGLPER
jgi:hypothetical protein